MLAIARNVKSGIVKDLCQIQAVFSNNPEALGLQKATEMGIVTHCIPSRLKKKAAFNAELLNWLKSNNPDLIVLAGYMKVLPSEIVCEFAGKIVNIHPADTTRHQGLHGYEWAWENRLQETKITVHFVDEGLDTGKIIAQRRVDLKSCNSLAEIEQTGLKAEHEFYSECLKGILSENSSSRQSEKDI
jgi:phosphoribosylglycinamide formyltransferase-1